VGLDPAGTAAVAAAVVRGGLDLVKDDETLTNQSFCPLVPKLEAIMNALDKAGKETGKKAFYAVNVTAGADSIREATWARMALRMEENDLSRAPLREEWHGYKGVLPVASGGAYPAKVYGNLDGYGIDCIVQAGGGVHGRPDGSEAGARVMIQAAEAWAKQIPLKEYLKDHKELETALRFWVS
jgi:ribulose 1,5-bisphosphate carboxylase large subunit-like protein